MAFSKVLRYFRVGDGRKRIKRYVFSNRNASVWLGHQRPIVMIISTTSIIKITIIVFIAINIIIVIILICHDQNFILHVQD